MEEPILTQTLGHKDNYTAREHDPPFLLGSTLRVMAKLWESACGARAPSWLARARICAISLAALVCETLSGLSVGHVSVV